MIDEFEAQMNGCYDRTLTEETGVPLKTVKGLYGLLLFTLVEEGPV